jgi:hypothetical protein
MHGLCSDFKGLFCAYATALPVQLVHIVSAGPHHFIANSRERRPARFSDSPRWRRDLNKWSCRAAISVTVSFVNRAQASRRRALFLLRVPLLELFNTGRQFGVDLRCAARSSFTITATADKIAFWFAFLAAARWR